eukprot:TRINITY_DN3434_c4_g1_i2.p1 TRINITY_DN3434_c4_g1~~TRINITY_DN3434_c4_g1_i2.p1  ORF type:complete len:527 (+),score=90.31 TRINITY_DN3434_c4_g1_i2:47-1582(+)
MTGQETRRNQAYLAMRGKLFPQCRAKDTGYAEMRGVLMEAAEEENRKRRNKRKPSYHHVGASPRKGGQLYLSESALKVNLYKTSFDQSTVRCSTITQDMELDDSVTTDSLKDNDTSHTSGTASQAEEEDCLAQEPAPPIAPLTVPTTQETHVIQNSSESDFSCRISHRIGEPEGLGPCVGKITRLKYSDNGSLSAGTETGVVFVIHPTAGPCVEPLRGHTSRVLDLEWSKPAQYLLSTSLDKTIRIWAITDTPGVKKSKCIRILHEPSVGVCLRFIPNNNNIFVMGTMSKALKFYNLSTGKPLTRLKIKRFIACLSWSSTGKGLFLADGSGKLSVCEYDTMLHSLKSPSSSLVLERGALITSLSLASPSDTDCDYLIANVISGTVCMVKARRVAPFTMSFHRKFEIPQRKAQIRSSFHPSAQSFATGSEDGSVWVFINPTDTPTPKVLKLQGHQGTVLNVSMNTAGWIASGDELGGIMIWDYQNTVAVTPPLAASAARCGSTLSTPTDSNS